MVLSSQDDLAIDRDLESRLRVQALPGKIFPQFIFQLVMSEARWWGKAAMDSSVHELKTNSSILCFQLSLSRPRRYSIIRQVIGTVLVLGVDTLKGDDFTSFSNLRTFDSA